jgi:hypothetical protein
MRAKSDDLQTGGADRSGRRFICWQRAEAFAGK